MMLLKVELAHYVRNELQRKTEDTVMMVMMVIITIIMEQNRYFYDNMGKKKRFNSKQKISDNPVLSSLQGRYINLF